MFKQPVKLCLSNSLNNFAALVRNQMHYSTLMANPRKWDLLSAVCLERHPIIIKPMNEIESKFKKMLIEVEFEGSMKSDHEIRMEREKKQAELQKQGLLDLDVDTVVKQTAQDLEDAGDLELAQFKFAPTITEADNKNIKNCLDRKLDKCLVLLVEQKIGNNNYWLPPQGHRADGETMRQAAERILKETCGDELKVRIYGNAPMGFYKYVYPKPIREKGCYGAKVFYYLARYINGEVVQTDKYQWLDREELEQIMPQPVHKSLSMFLVPE